MFVYVGKNVYYDFYTISIGETTERKHVVAVSVAIINQRMRPMTREKSFKVIDIKHTGFTTSAMIQKFACHCTTPYSIVIKYTYGSTTY